MPSAAMDHSHDLDRLVDERARAIHRDELEGLLAAFRDGSTGTSAGPR